MPHRSIFLSIEINLLLWLVAAFRSEWDGVVVLGLLLAVGLQHWAYYALIKDGRGSAGASPG